MALKLLLIVVIFFVIILLISLMMDYQKLFHKFDKVLLKYREDRFIWNLPPKRDGVEGYYLVKRLNMFDEYIFDDHRIPHVRYRRIGIQHNPVTVAQYALSLLNTFIENGSIRLKEEFLYKAQWLVNNASYDRGYAVWYYKFPLLGMSAPWISGMAQGQIVSVMVRAYEMTNDHRYIDVAKSAMNAFYREVENGGVLRRIGGEYIILEECPTTPPSMILNGFIYSIFGIFDYIKVTNDPEAKELLHSCIVTLNKILPDYDTGLWSRYDHPSYGSSGWASVRYHLEHINQLKILASLTNNSMYDHIASKWFNYTTKRKNRLAFVIARNYYRLKRFCLKL